MKKDKKYGIDYAVFQSFVICFEPVLSVLFTVIEGVVGKTDDFLRIIRVCRIGSRKDVIKRAADAMVSCLLLVAGG